MKDVDDQTRQNADEPIDLDRDATIYVTQQGMLRREKQWVTNFFTTGVWDTDKVGVTDFTQWDDATSTPIEDVNQSQMDVAAATGFKPNVLVIGPRVFQALKSNADILDRIKYTQRGVVTTDLLAALFDVDRVLVPMAVENTATEGAADSIDFFFGKSALLAYSNPNPSILTPSAGYTFSWTGLVGAGDLGNRIKRFRMEQLESDRIELSMAFDHKVVSSDLAVFFSSAVS